MQENVTAYTAKNTMDELGEVFFEFVIGRGRWPPRSFDSYPCGFHLWGTLKEKVHVKNWHYFEELQENIRTFVCVGYIERNSVGNTECSSVCLHSVMLM
jgi:hypothetical protein